MKLRNVDQYRESTRTSDGAGVTLFRLFSREDTLEMDPFLMLDSFESSNPEDYLAGFPFHPHRGIQTFTYVIHGEIEHKDSMGNQGNIHSGEYQWMSAGSGVFHEEMPQKSDYFLGMQLWINLPQAEKMSRPLYVDGNTSNIPLVEEEIYKVHVLSGTFQGVSKLDLPGKFPVDMYDFEIQPHTEVEIPVPPHYRSLVYALLGEIIIGDHVMVEKSGATLKDGNTVLLKTGEKPARVLYFAGEPLEEPIAWGGPVVMNTQEELRQAQEDLRNGTFVKDELTSL